MMKLYDKRVLIVLLSSCLILLMANSVLACPQDTAWTGKQERKVKDFIGAVEKQAEKVNQLEGTSQEAGERAKLVDMLDGANEFKDEIGDARKRNDSLAVRKYKKSARKLRDIRDDLGGPPVQKELTGRHMNKDETRIAEGVVGGLKSKREDINVKAIDMAKNSDLDDTAVAAKQQQIIADLENLKADAEKAEAHFRELAGQAYEDGQTNLASDYGKYAEEAQSVQQSAVDGLNFAGMATGLINL